MQAAVCWLFWIALSPHMHFFIPVKSSVIHAVRFGSGERLLICFHGFGEEAGKFMALQPSLHSLFTVVAVDLPFHGNTQWQQGTPFLPDDLAEVIHAVLHREKKERFSLMGYSLGGKIVLAAVKLFAEQVDSIILAAPDGVILHAWYNVAVYPEWGRKLFKRFVENPGFVFRLARLLRFTGILNQRIYKFLQVQTNTEAKRKRIYAVWMAMKNLEVDLPEVKELLNKYRIRSYVFIGKYDRVITRKTGDRFAHGLQDCHYVVLEKGHNLITESFNNPLQEVLMK